MSRLTFRSGGVHPPTHKDLAPSDGYDVLPIPDTLTIPMAQHLGAPATVTVKKKAALEAGAAIRLVRRSVGLVVGALEHERRSELVP